MTSQPEFFGSAPKCQHSSVKTTLTPELTHYARQDCLSCGKFLRWLPKPETIERQAENGRKMAALRDSSKLTAWEKAFIFSLEKQGRNFSPKQQATLNKIYDAIFATQDSGQTR